MRLDDRIRVLAFRPHLLEHFLGDLAGDGLIGDAREQAGQPPRVDARLRDLDAVLVERGRQLAHHPVRRELLVAAERRDTTAS